MPAIVKIPETDTECKVIIQSKTLPPDVKDSATKKSNFVQSSKIDKNQILYIKLTAKDEKRRWFPNMTTNYVT